MNRVAVLPVLLIVVGGIMSSSLGQASAPTATQPVDDPFLITPGVGIGKVRIGMPIAAVISVLGAPKQVWRGRGTGNVDVYTWFEMPDCAVASPTGGLLVYADLAGAVTGVVAYNDARYFLETGLHVGSNGSEIYTRMGRGALSAEGLAACREHILFKNFIQYTALGITFGGREPRIAWVGVHTPGQETMDLPRFGGHLIVRGA